MIHSFKTNIITESGSNLMWNFRVIVPDNIVQKYIQTDKRMIVKINDSEEIHCAMLSNGDGTYFFMMNGAFRKKNNLYEGDQVEVNVKKDDSKYGIKSPDFFEDLCYQDPDANRLFHALTPGKQRSLLHIVGKLKSEQKQLEKCLIIFEYLKDTQGKLDFKELNSAFKSSRFRK